MLSGQFIKLMLVVLVLGSSSCNNDTEVNPMRVDDRAAVLVEDNFNKKDIRLFAGLLEGEFIPGIDPKDYLWYKAAYGSILYASGGDVMSEEQKKVYFHQVQFATSYNKKMIAKVGKAPNPTGDTNGGMTTGTHPVTPPLSDPPSSPPPPLPPPSK